jgi:uncharacterized protein (TIGR02678 family)
MSSADPAVTLRDAIDEVTADELQHAARALLRRPLLTADGPHAAAFALVRRRATALREWFADEAGWHLSVDAQHARLHKIPAHHRDATRPAGAEQRAPFGQRRYVLLCLALAVLERADSQTTLGRLAEQIIDAASDPALGEAGVTFRMEAQDERRDLVAVVRLLLQLQALRKVAGEEEAFLRSTGDALYDVDRRVLSGLLAARRGPSTITATSLDDRLDALSAEVVADTDEGRRRAARQSLTRRLLDDPVVYTDDLSDTERDYWQSQRAALVRRVADATGLEPEVRAEGVAMLDPHGDASDIGMPEEGTDGHATLLLAEHFAAIAGPVPVEALEARMAELVVEHGRHWRKPAREPGAHAGLCAHALDTLEALGLIARDDGGVTPRPALARYAVDGPTLLGDPTLVPEPGGAP